METADKTASFTKETYEKAKEKIKDPKTKEEIEQFKPRPFYRLVPKIGNKSNNQMISLEYEESVQYNYNEAIRLKNVIESRREVLVQENLKKECLT